MSSFHWDTKHEILLTNLLRKYYKAKRPDRLAPHEIWRVFWESMLWEDCKKGTFPESVPSLKDMSRAGSASKIGDVLQEWLSENAVTVPPPKQGQVARFLCRPGVVKAGKFALPAYLKKLCPRNGTLEEQQEIRRRLVALAEGALTLEGASRLLVKSQICLNLVVNYVELCDKLSRLEIPVPSWNPEQEESRVALEKELLRLAQRHKIRVCQVAGILTGDAPEQTQQKRPGDALSNEEMDYLAQMAKEEAPRMGEIGIKLWNCFKDDVRKGFKRWRRRLQEVGLDYEDYESAAREFFLRKIKSYEPHRSPFAPYFRKYLGREMNRWARRRTCANADDPEKRVVKHRELVKRLRESLIIREKPPNMDTRQVWLAIATIKRECCVPGARVKLMSQSEIKTDSKELLPFVPVLRTWLKDLFPPEEVPNLAAGLKGRQREVFILYFGGQPGTTEQDVAAKLGTSQQNVSKIRERAVRNVLEKEVFPALEREWLYSAKNLAD